jgi:hypothetical protein
MTSKYAVVVIGADGATDIIGPYTSEGRARRDADRIATYPEGVAADVYLLDPPRNAGEYLEAAAPAPEPHRATWWVHAGTGRIRHTAAMRGSWGYDVTCSCGWDSRTGGGLRRYVAELLGQHRDDVAAGEVIGEAVAAELRAAGPQIDAAARAIAAERAAR